MSSINVVCVKVGTKYGPEYPNILYDMVSRNLDEGKEGKFWCITDDASGLHPDILVLTPPKDLTGWWSKLWMFSPGLFPEGERILYFDLDVTIVGPLDDVTEYAGDFAILKEFAGAPGWQSSIMAWRSGFAHEVWDEWNKQDRPEVCGGDQEWVEEVLGSADYLQNLFPEAFLSYKLDCRVGFPPRGAKVVIFHGEPKPDNCGEEWVRMVWKIGGGTAAELDLVCNTNDEVLKANVRSACKRDVPWLKRVDEHAGHAVIVGGAPSVAEFLDEIKWRQSLGQKVFALNNAARYLSKNNIVPDAHVLVDAREDNVSFLPFTSRTTHYIASQCAPVVWDKAMCLDAVLWHSYNEILDDALENPAGKPECLVGGGTTVGLSAIALVTALGYRTIHIYGMDSSYTDEKHHAYAQPLNDGERVLDVVCADRKFRCAPWMIAQANQFQILLCKLVEENYTFTVQGEGLIPWMARLIQLNSIHDYARVQDENGTWWPSRDKLAQSYIIDSLRSIPKIVYRCTDKRVAVQAGGNVGLWPKRLSDFFDEVITFEPDSLNFECLGLNCANIPNIRAYKKALGAKSDRKALYRDPSNCGAHAIVDGDEFDVVSIDSLNLHTCDLIQLDVEGYELFALQGAEDTIRRCSPTICVELKSLGKGYGIQDEQVVAWLRERGYREKMKLGRDVLFVHETKDPVWKHHKACITDTSQQQTEHL